MRGGGGEGEWVCLGGLFFFFYFNLPHSEYSVSNKHNSSAIKDHIFSSCNVKYIPVGNAPHKFHGNNQTLDLLGASP